MAGPFYIDDGGDGTTESTWATADTSINDLIAEYTLASGEIVYFGHNSVCQASNSAALSITGPASGAPVIFISATQGSDPPTYALATADQIDTTESTYNLTFNGSFAIYGLQVDVGGIRCILDPDSNESLYWHAGRIKLAANSFVAIGASSVRRFVRLEDVAIDLTNDGDGSTGRNNWVIGDDGWYGSRIELINLTFTNAVARTLTIFSFNGGSYVYISGLDLSGFTHATECEILGETGSLVVMSNCITKSGFVAFSTATRNSNCDVTMTNVGPADAPTSLIHRGYNGDIVSSDNSIYRTGGATVETVPVSWGVTTTAACTEGSPYYTPWIYGTTTAGSKTFDLYITHDANTTYDADFTDAQVWLEVEYLSTSDEAIWALATDQRATITTTAVAQTDDSSTWNGTGPSFTYKQKLSVTATVGEAGQFRARVAVGAATIVGNHFFYIDPKVTVT